MLAFVVGVVDAFVRGAARVGLTVDWVRVEVVGFGLGFVFFGRHDFGARDGLRRNLDLQFPPCTKKSTGMGSVGGVSGANTLR